MFLFRFIQQGIPTLDVKGEKISKGLTKKLEKLQITQEKKFNEYLASINNGSWILNKTTRYYFLLFD